MNNIKVLLYWNTIYPHKEIDLIRKVNKNLSKQFKIRWHAIQLKDKRTDYCNKIAIDCINEN